MKDVHLEQNSEVVCKLLECAVHLKRIVVDYFTKCCRWCCGVVVGVVVELMHNIFEVWPESCTGELDVLTNCNALSTENKETKAFNGAYLLILEKFHVHSWDLFSQNYEGFIFANDNFQTTLRDKFLGISNFAVTKNKPVFRCKTSCEHILYWRSYYSSFFKVEEHIKSFTEKKQNSFPKTRKFLPRSFYH